MKLPVTQPQSYTDAIPNGEVLEVELVQVEEPRETQYGPRMTWVFRVTEPGPWEGRQVRGMTSTSFTRHSECKAYNWANAMTGDKYEDVDEFDTDSLRGFAARVIIQHTPKKDGDGVWENVVSVLPPRQVRNTNTAQTAPF